MNLYYITIGSFRNIIIKTEMNPAALRTYVMNHLGWNPCTVSILEPGTLEDIPMHPELEKKFK